MSDYVAAAYEAAPAFGLEHAEIEILHKSENVVCKVTMPDEQLVMRLHRPGYTSIDELKSEVQWVKALGAAGIPVPTARPTLDGDYYTAVEVGDRTLQVGVVEWVEGDTLANIATQDGERRSLVDDYRRIGELSASIRRHAMSWTPPDGFVRRRWDVDGFLGETPAWGRFWDVAALTSKQRDLFNRARTSLIEELSNITTASSHFGLIHADLHNGNVMAKGDKLTIIDFDDSGYSWYAYDLAVALQPLLGDDSYTAARAAMIEGYRSIHRFGDDEEASIDTFLTVRSLIDVSWLADRSELPGYVQMPQYIARAEQMAARYLLFE